MSEREVLLPALLQNVVGFDLNPLAVLSARANFLLVIADLLQPSTLNPQPLTLEEVELPIYLADSIVLPAEGQTANLAVWGLTAEGLAAVQRSLRE